MLDDDLCYAALTRRDPGADGIFFVGVRTTGIYCRPICPARIPLRRNIRFFQSAAAAQVAGLRPCLRCRPESAPDSPAWQGSMAVVNRALRIIDEGFLVEAGLDALTARLGLTPRHLRRLFDKHIGAGPIAIEQTRRVNLAKKLLHETAMPITDVAFAAGFGSVRRFNEVFLQLFGRAPSSWRRLMPAVLDKHARGFGRGAANGQGGAAVTVSIAYRPPLDWRACTRRAVCKGARIEGQAIIMPVDPASDPSDAVHPAQPCVELVPGPGHTLSARLNDVPIGLMARAIVQAKRAVFSDLAQQDPSRGGAP